MDVNAGRQGNVGPFTAAAVPTRGLAGVMLAVLAAVLFVGGCGWFRWRDLALTHIDLLERMADDAVATYVSAVEHLEPGDIERLRYPLTRAREFASSSRRRFGTAPWLDRFDAMLEAYAGLVDWLDRARTQPVSDAERALARERFRLVRDSAAETRAALDARA
jgi:hypothetical protein